MIELTNIFYDTFTAADFEIDYNNIRYYIWIYYAAPHYSYELYYNDGSRWVNIIKNSHLHLTFVVDSIINYMVHHV